MNDVTDVLADGADSVGGQEPDSWYYSNQEGNVVAGQGDKPEFLLDKYNSVADQAAAYPELAKKFGGFTGAPEDYSLEFMGEGYEAGDSYTDAANMMKELGVSQEAFEKLWTFHESELAQVYQSYSDPERELADLGQDHELRLDNVDRFLRANLSDEEYKEAAEGVTSAAHVRMIEKLIGATKPKQLPSQGGQSTTGMTESKLEEMYRAKDSNGNPKYQTDPSYRKMIDEEYENFYGNGNNVQTIG